MENVITAAQVKAIGGSSTPMATAQIIADLINTDPKAMKLDTPLRLAHFLGHDVVESTAFTRLEENLYYSAKRLMAVWPSRFRTLAIAKQYEKNPQKLANYTYNGRLGNAAGSNDGWNYRGGGMKMVTGKYNHIEFNNWIHDQPYGANAPDFVKHPEELRRFPWAFYSAIWYWVTQKVYLKADKDDIPGSTKAINGGYIGLDLRTTAINRAKRVLIDQAGAVKTKKAPKEPDQLLKQYQAKLNTLSDLRGDKKLNVGKADGWNGDKTTKAVKYFQKSADLVVDGDLGKNTREAIDNVLAALQQPKMLPMAAFAAPREVAEELAPEVIEIPAEVPEELEHAKKSMWESKTLYSYLTGASGFVLSVWNGALDWFSNADPMLQTALVVMLTVALVLSFMSLRDRFKIQTGVRKMIKDNEVFQNVIAGVTAGIARRDEE